MNHRASARGLFAATAALSLVLALAPSSAMAANYQYSDYPRPTLAQTNHPAGFNDAAEVTVPGPRCNVATTIVSAGGVRVAVRTELAPLVRELLDRTQRMGYAMDPASTGGFNCRYIRGSSTTPSNHSYGRAIDINWNQNPQGSPFRSTLPPAVVKMWQDAGFYWGGHFRTPDTMHFEYVAAKSAISTYYQRLTGSPLPTTPPPAPAPSTETAFPTVKQGSANKAAVVTLQYALQARGYTVTVDGAFGPQTNNAVRAFQSSRALTVDGVVGAKTWPALLPTLRQGSTGSAVKALQVELRAAGYALTVDGSFGTRTKAAVVAYQSAQRLTADGVVGAKTWGSLVD